MTDFGTGGWTDTPASIVADETAARMSLVSLVKALKNMEIDATTDIAAIEVLLTAMAADIAGIEIDVAAIEPVITNQAFTGTAKITRPANVTQYAIGDVVGGASLEFDVARANGGGGWINNAAFASDSVVVATGLFIAWIFTAAPTVAADNAAFAPSDAELRTWIGSLVLDRARVTANNSSYEQSDPRATYFVCAAADTSLYVVITAGSTYTPANGEVLDLTLFGTME